MKFLHTESPKHCPQKRINTIVSVDTPLPLLRPSVVSLSGGCVPCPVAVVRVTLLSKAWPSSGSRCSPRRGRRQGHAARWWSLLLGGGLRAQLLMSGFLGLALFAKYLALVHTGLPI